MYACICILYVPALIRTNLHHPIIFYTNIYYIFTCHIITLLLLQVMDPSPSSRPLLKLWQLQLGQLAVVCKGWRCWRRAGGISGWSSSPCGKCGTIYMGVSENSVPLNPMVNDQYPVFKWLFHWEYTLFLDKPIYHNLSWNMNCINESRNPRQSWKYHEHHD